METVAGILARNELGLPLWAWVLAGGGAILVVIYLKKRQGTTDQNVTGGGGIAPVPATIDPYTSVPYSIESAINPATGLPAYYGVGSSGAPGVGGTGGGTNSGPINPPGPPNPPPANTQTYSLAQLISLGYVPSSAAQYESQFPGSYTLQQWYAMWQSAGGHSTVVPTLPIGPSGGVNYPVGIWPSPATFR